jgi:drug/metabolite transporter (DMT)-like permease
MEMTRPDRLTLVAFIIIVILGGSNAVAVRFSNMELPPFFGAALRFTAASLILFIVVFLLRLPLPKGRALGGTALAGLLAFGINYALFYWSLLYIQAGLLQVLLALAPLLTCFFAWAHGLERFRWQTLIGGLVAMAGIAVIFWNQLSANAPIIPMLAVVFAAACVAESTILFKIVPKSHPITTNAVGMAAGAILLFLAAAIWGETALLPKMLSTWIAVGYLIVFGSIGVFVLMLFVLGRWTASATSYSLVLLPIVTIPVGAWLIGEAVTIGFLIGGAIVLVGVYIGALAPPDFLSRLSGRRLRQFPD